MRGDFFFYYFGSTQNYNIEARIEFFWQYKGKKPPQ